MFWLSFVQTVGNFTISVAVFVFVVYFNLPACPWKISWFTTVFGLVVASVFGINTVLWFRSLRKEFREKLDEFRFRQSIQKGQENESI